ncbi:MAG: Crp/Fnr family transcriptional regulator [Candidatus Sericytochromatia bacterium]
METNTLDTQFRTFSPDLLRALKEEGRNLSFATEQEILRPGSEVKVIPLVLNGSIRVLRDDPSGKEILLYYIHPGESCVLSILAGSKAQTSQIRAIAQAGTEIWVFPAQVLKRWSLSHASWNQFVLELYTIRFEELVQVVNELAFSRVDERLLDLLQTRAKLAGGSLIQATHQQLADELGTAREVVSRLLKKLEQEQRVELGRGKIIWLG